MEKIRKIWSDFRTQPDIWFFYGFLANFTLSIRKVLVFYPITGRFNEYTGIYLYLSDLFLILTLAFWILSCLYNKKLNLSIYTHKLSTLTSRHNLLITIPLALIIWSFVSIGWSGNWQISLFRSVKFLEFYLLYIYVIFRIVPSHYTGECSTPVIQKCSTWNILGITGQAWNNVIRIIILTGLFQSIIGIWQFIIQKSIVIFWLKESLISPSIAGVAKVLIGGEKYIRAYGLFPHPNILGGFLLVSIVLSLFYTKLFHSNYSTCSTPAPKDQIVPSQLLGNVPPTHYRKCSTWNIFRLRGTRGTFQEQRDMRGTISECGACVEQFFSLRNGTFIYLLPIFVLIQIIALFLTFSKSAWIGLFLALAYIYFRLFHPRTTEFVPRGTNSECGASVEQFRNLRGGTILAVALLVIVLALFIPKLNLSDFLFKSINERILYLDDSVRVIKSSPIIGIGSGQFVLDMQKYSQTQLEYWQFQPVHNVFLLIWSELGIIGLGLFLWFMWKLFHPSYSKMFHPRTTEFVPPQYYRKCSTWNIFRLRGMRGTNSECGASARLHRYARRQDCHQAVGLAKHCGQVEQLTIFKGILLGLIFIMLFDHYLWDIQQGQVILWLIVGIIANNALYKPKDSILTK